MLKPKRSRACALQQEKPPQGEAHALLSSFDGAPLKFCIHDGSSLTSF